MPREHCRHFLFISQDPAGESPSQEFSQLYSSSPPCPCSAPSALGADLHYSICLLIICVYFAGNFPEAENLPCSLLHLQHRAQCVAHSRLPSLLTGSLFSGEPLWTLSGLQVQLQFRDGNCSRFLAFSLV